MGHPPAGSKYLYFEQSQNRAYVLTGAWIHVAVFFLCQVTLARRTSVERTVARATANFLSSSTGLGAAAPMSPRSPSTVDYNNNRCVVKQQVSKNIPV